MGELYQLFFPESGKSYIGITTETVLSRYARHRRSADSVKWPIYRAWRKYGAPKLIILAILENDELAGAEIKAISIFNTLVPNGYNLSAGGELSPSKHPLVAQKISKALLGGTLSQETKDKISIAHKGKKLWTDEQKVAIGKRQEGKKRSPETIENMIKANVGKYVRSEETKEKMRLANIGKKLTIETRRKMSETRKGKKQSPETIEKRRQKLIGKHRTIEARKRMSEAQKGRRPT